MDNFIVSARKYRPITFDTVIGQENITTTLKNAIKNNQVAQAFLFCGSRGVGKTTCARILAKTLNCKNLNDKFEACEECEPCVSFRNNTSFNIYELDAASNNSVDDIRALSEQVRIPPQSGKYKVYIIDEVHMLSQSAFNAFLKTLEEPPPYAKFILATTEKHKIIPTILSRCQVYDFKRITVNDIVMHLEFVAKNENVNIDTEALHVIAQKADGAMRDALSIFDQLVSFTGKVVTYDNVITNLNVLDLDNHFKMLDFVFENNTPQTLNLFNEIIHKGFDSQHFIVGFGHHLRNLLVCLDSQTIKLLEVSDNNKLRYQNQASRTNYQELLRYIEIINQCDINYRNSNNRHLLVELSLLKMSVPQDVDSEEKKNKVIHIEPKIEKESKIEETLSLEINVEPIIYDNKPKEKRNEILVELSPLLLSGIKTNVNEQEVDYNLHLSEIEIIDFNIVWEKVANVYKQKDKTSLYFALTSSKPVIEGDIINIQVQNRIQDEEVKENQYEILEYLKTSLNNNKLTIISQVTEIVLPTIIYQADEKFEVLSQINPAVIKLKKEFNLELDY